MPEFMCPVYCHNLDSEMSTVTDSWCVCPRGGWCEAEIFYTDNFQVVMTRENQQRPQLTSSLLKHFSSSHSWQGTTLPPHTVNNPQQGMCQGRPHCGWNHCCFYSFTLIYKQKCYRGQSPASCHTATNWSWTPTVRPQGGQLAWWWPSDTILPTHTVCWN